ncbi:MAG: reverse transcriptase domain-containing protein [Candidatus Thiodiazotropha endolucinida]|nr:endonuclease/exonuclease/phosphatase family protein [Candidatus Thiodiazotropha taylori]MCW4343850.1 reverse transcriptase domain-containing protein [Candidatus Thiodiazotropha endolucinida]
MRQINSLKISCWNINGYTHKGYNKYTDPDFLINLTQHDIVCLLETHCNLEESLILPDYKAVHLFRPKAKITRKVSGGMSVFVRKKLIKGIKFLNHENNDYIWLQLQKDFFGLTEDIYICFLYFSPEYSTYTQSLDYDLVDILEKEITKYQKYGKILIGGDFNARVGMDRDYIDQDSDSHLPMYDTYIIDSVPVQRYSHDLSVNTRGKRLLSLCVQCGLRILNGRMLGDSLGQYTSHQPSGSSVIDYFIASESMLNTIPCFSVHNLQADFSDHCQISLQLQTHISTDYSEERINPLPLKYVWNDGSSVMFQQALNSVEIKNKIKTFMKKDFGYSDSLDAATELTEILQSAASKSLKMINIKTSSNENIGKEKNSKNLKWYDVSLRKARFVLTNKEKLFRKHSNDPYIRSSFYKTLKEFRKLRKQKRRQYRQEILNKLDSMLENNPSAYWKLLDELKDDNKNHNKGEAISSSDWLKHFSSLNDQTITPNTDFKDKLEYLEKEKVFNELDYLLSEKEILNGIKELKNKKSSGCDSILNEMLKYGHSSLLHPLQKLFNLVLSSTKYPAIWSQGIITPLHKKGSLNDPSNYRGITISSCIGKLFNKILNNRLVQYLQKHSILCKEQIGFIKGNRTTDHMFILKSLVDRHTHKGSLPLFTCFVDFKRAFDTVWHDGLFYKLRKIGLSDKFYHTIKNMYASTKLSVKVGNCRTDSFSSSTGVRQGDNLSPTLFNIFINDIPACFDPSCDPVKLTQRCINCLLYADDLILVSNSAEGLQNCMDKLSTFCKDWGMNVNLDKTKSLVFSSGTRQKKIHITFQGNNIENVKSYTYLGVTFSHTGCFNEAKNNLYLKGLKAQFKLSKSFYPQPPNIKTSFHIFDHTIQPIITYGSEIWGPFSSQKLLFKKDYLFNMCDKLQQEKLHLKFCKYLLGVNSKASNLAVRGETGRYPILLQILSNMFKYLVHLKTSKNDLLIDAYNLSTELGNKGIDSWVYFIKSVLSFLNIDADINSDYKHLYRKVQKTLISKFTLFWTDKIKTYTGRDQQQGNKLRTYCCFKQNFSQEKYLGFGSRKQRAVLCKFRISNHRLEIEQGRYKNVKADQRICKLCKNAVEDEIHFLLQCPTLENIRTATLSMVYKLYPNVEWLNDKDKLIWLMSTEDSDMIHLVQTLLSTLSEKRIEKLNAL